LKIFCDTKRVTLFIIVNISGNSLTDIKNKNKARKNEQQLERNQTTKKKKQIKNYHKLQKKKTTTPAAFQMENGKQQCYIRLCYIYNAA
jgi:hypothetical protein